MAEFDAEQRETLGILVDSQHITEEQAAALTALLSHAQSETDRADALEDQIRADREKRVNKTIVIRDQAQRDAARYREALERIAEVDQPNRLVIARAALQPTPPEQEGGAG